MAEPRRYTLYFTFLALCPRACRAAELLHVIFFSHSLFEALKKRRWIGVADLARLGRQNVKVFSKQKSANDDSASNCSKAYVAFLPPQELSDLIHIIYCTFKKLNTGFDTSWHAGVSLRYDSCATVSGWEKGSAWMESEAFCCSSLTLFFMVPAGLWTDSECHQVSSQVIRGTLSITKTGKSTRGKLFAVTFDLWIDPWKWVTKHNISAATEMAKCGAVSVCVCWCC